VLQCFCVRLNSAPFLILIKNQLDALISQICFRKITPHVSDTISVHQQECSTLHTAIGIGYTGYADYLLAGSGWNSSSYLILLASTVPT